ncbi:TPA: hypothetical protein ACTYIV_000948 [Citrobacter koseri]
MKTNNHPAHGSLSNYRLHRISDILSKAAAQSDGGNIGYAMSDAVKAFDELLEVRGAKPIGITDRSEIECLKRGEMANVMPPDYKGVDAGDEVFVYTAPPAPAVPATLPCAVELKPGLIIGKGCKTETLLTALQRRADYYAEIDAMTPEERAEHDANIEAFKAMLPQPVPVVPEEATPDNIEILASTRVDSSVSFQWDEDERNAAADSWNACRAAMLNGGKS